MKQTADKLISLIHYRSGSLFGYLTTEITLFTKLIYVIGEKVQSI